MKTRIRTITETSKNDNHYQEAMNTAGAILKAGGLVAFPTETVYGLGADARSCQAARKIYEAKGRPSDNPLIVHISDIGNLEAIAKDIPEKAWKAAKEFWPGPLTMIFKKKDLIPLETTGGLDTVAVRLPDNEIARDLIKAGGGFIAAPSANTSGRPSPTTAEHVMEDMNGSIDMILDGGAVKIGLESTILDMTVQPPAILRPGAVTAEMLSELIGEIQDGTAEPDESIIVPKAPGMKYRHYAPKARMVIVEGAVDSVVDEINKRIDENEKKGIRTGVIASEETAGRYHTELVKSVGPRERIDIAAGRLYRILREFDNENPGIIYSEAFGDDGIGAAVRNRLVKAAGHQIIQVKNIKEE